ncbi:MAG TPA: aminodeoxychorismate synthase component I [Anaerolineales bacterium]|nr:aminodeoxychorismate synthase component I [Anaerolineales bacterium]
MTCAWIQDDSTGQWWHFSDPIGQYTAHQLADVPTVLVQADQAVHDPARPACWAVGFVSYTASAAFDRALPYRPTTGTSLPFAHFTLYRTRSLSPLPAPQTVFQLTTWQAAISPQSYQAAIAHIKNQIAAGNTYQVNFTFPLFSNFSGDPYALFWQMTQAMTGQRGNLGAFLQTAEWAVCSASPELFFRRDGTQITCRPMKGTAPRGRWLAEDQAIGAELRHSIKNRAENVMIVDMIRNDLGRVAEVGSVHVPALFETTPYPTLWQMTSTVQATSHASLPDLFSALFPCASITGAPKVRTMQIIHQLESHPRDLYCGAIGYWGNDGQAQFNVAIRTVQIDRTTQTARYDVGSGIIWDSESTAEYDECLVKARLLTEDLPEFELYETLRWEVAGGYWLLEEHLHRLAESAAYWGFVFDKGQVLQCLLGAAQHWHSPQRVRITLDRHGTLQLSYRDLPPAESAPIAAQFATTPVQSANRWLFHKTSYRAVYEHALAQVRTPDVILWNERAEITETSIGNLVLELDGSCYTPSRDSGLLAGTLRAHLLATGKIQERTLTRADLLLAQRVWRINSVRGWNELQILPA